MEVGKAEIRITATGAEKFKQDMSNVNSEVDKLKKEFTEFQSVQEKGKAIQEDYSVTFQKTTTTLLAMGNIANSVDNILSGYQNLQLRIENAELRVLDAREALNKITAEGKIGTEEYVNAQRRLEISENNLARAQNAVVGTYINMSLQIVTLTASLPSAIKGIQEMIIAVKLLDATTKSFLMTTGVGIAIVAAGWGLSKLIPMLSDTKTQVEENTIAIQSYSEELSKIPLEIKTKVMLENIGAKEVENLYPLPQEFINKLTYEAKLPNIEKYAEGMVALQEQIRLQKELTDFMKDANLTEYDTLVKISEKKKEIMEWEYKAEVNLGDNKKDIMNELINKAKEVTGTLSSMGESFAGMDPGTARAIQMQRVINAGGIVAQSHGE